MTGVEMAAVAEGVGDTGVWAVQPTTTKANERSRNILFTGNDYSLPAAMRKILAQKSGTLNGGHWARARIILEHRRQ